MALGAGYLVIVRTSNCPQTGGHNNNYNNKGALQVHYSEMQVGRLNRTPAAAWDLTIHSYRYLFFTPE